MTEKPLETQDDLEQWNVAPTSKMAGYGFGYIIVNYLLLYGLQNMDYIEILSGISKDTYIYKED